MNPTRTHFAGIVLGLGLLAGLGCSGSLMPGSAQQGSTVVLPLVTANGLVGIWGDNVYEPAYGGSDFTDTQHGRLVVWLYDPITGAALAPLLTRMVVPVDAPVESPLGRFQVGKGRQLLLIADVPKGPSAPLGTVKAALFRVPPDESGLLPASAHLFYDTLSILPETVNFLDESASMNIDVTGMPASVDMQVPGGTNNWGSGLHLALPRYTFEINLRDTGSKNLQRASRVAIKLQYPKDLISIANVYPRETLLTHVIHHNDAALGELTIEGVTLDHPGSTSMGFRVHFAQKTAAPLDLAALTVIDLQVSNVLTAGGASLCEAHPEGSCVAENPFQISFGW